MPSSSARHQHNVKFEELLSQPWCDLLFAHRNKEYGAYALRRNAGRRYRRALSVMLFFVLSAVALPWIVKGLVLLNLIESAQQFKEEGRLEKLKPLQEHRLVEVAAGRRPRKATSSQTTTSETEIVDTAPLPTTDLPKGEDSPEEGGAEQLEPTTSLPLQKDTLAPIQKDPIIPIKAVEEMPQFPGGPARLMQWLDENITYSEHLRKKKVKGQAEVSFIVNKEGVVSDIRLTKKVHPALDREIIEALKAMPQWTPGKRGGRVTEVQITIPIDFHLR